MRAWATHLGAVLAVLVGAAGCARHGLKLGWVDDAALSFDSAQYRADPAVVLHRSEHQLMMLADESYTQFGRHELVALQSEGGFDLAEVKVAFRAKNKLKELRARMRHPDGSWIRGTCSRTPAAPASGTSTPSFSGRWAHRSQNLLP